MLLCFVLRFSLALHSDAMQLESVSNTVAWRTAGSPDGPETGQEMPANYPVAELNFAAAFAKQLLDAGRTLLQMDDCRQHPWSPPDTRFNMQTQLKKRAKIALSHGLSVQASHDQCWPAGCHVSFRPPCKSYCLPLKNQGRAILLFEPLLDDQTLKMKRR